MSPGKRSTAHGSMWVDLRIPFAVTIAEGLLLLGLVALAAYLELPRLPLIALAVLVFYLVTAGGILISYTWRYTAMKRAEEAAEQISGDVYRMFRAEVDIPYAVVNGDGAVRVINTALQNILGFRSPVCNLPLGELCPEVSFDKLKAARFKAIPEEEPSVLTPLSAEDPGLRDTVTRLPDGRRYRVECHLMPRERDHYYFLVFRDVDDYLELSEQTARDRVVLAYIMLDNLQELTQFVRANYRATANLIEEALTKWVEGMGGMLREYDRDKYLALFSAERLDECVQAGFPILDDIMNIRVGDNSFPLSVSMGIADVSGSMQDKEKAASGALDMALQRGGNQVALQRSGVGGLSYFGGTHKTLESNTSISSRVSAHLLEKRLETCDHVLIMGHANPDFDSVGSCVGAYRLCRSILEAKGRGSVPVHVVANKTCDTFEICYGHLSALPEYESVFIDKAAAQQTVTTHTMLVITDVNNPYIFEAPQLVSCIPAAEGVSNIAIIDHHRIVDELPFTPFLHYIEATKSSASEIVAEILQQSDYAETLHKEEANLLLAGIMLDTHNFTRSAGAQTFDITYYLYSRNAHTGVVREFFNERIDELLVAGDFDAHTRVYDGVFAITWLSEEHIPSPNDRIAASKAADKLLTLRGIEASFAFAPVGSGISISARSKGRINVQLIMEKLEGGGHFDMAGAQVTGGIPEAYDLLVAAIDEYKLQFPEQFRSGDASS
ncbi:MAG: DHH family phosphoesterase [Clostridia bacterium]|nr:DHH family phosphoesterase [Clostridia bacterium]